MKARIMELDIPAHQAIQELLPWFVSGQLAPDEAARVAGHVDSCEQCSKDVAWQRRMHDQSPAMPAGLDMEAALARLLPRLEQPAGGLAQREAAKDVERELEPEPEPERQLAPELPRHVVRLSRPRPPAANQPSWLRATVVAQFALIACLGLILVRQGDAPPAYHALGAAPSGGNANVVVTFRPDTSERELRRILQANSARLVDGPTVTDAYLLNVAPAARAAALSALRAERAVTLAEPLDAEAAP